MRWIVSCSPETKVISENLFSGAIATNYFSICDDERTASHSLNTAISEAQTLTFNEDIILGVGSSSFQVLNSPHNPVRTILSTHFAKGSSATQTLSSSPVLPGSKLVTLSISSFNNSTLASGGTPLALRVAQGLGMVQQGDSQWIRSPFSDLNFGSRESTGHVVQVVSATEADSIIGTLFKSPSFQRHLHSMSLCLRISFAVHSDAANDGDDFPHWVNEQILTLWFVNDRHIGEFITSFDSSVKHNKPARIIIGFARVTSLESAASCANSAAHAWQVASQNDHLRPISLAGRPPHGSLGTISSPLSRDIKASHDFVVAQRNRLLEETAAYIRSGKVDEGRSSIAESRTELDDLGKKFDESEKKFSDLASHLEKERGRFRVTEDEVKTVAADIERSQNEQKEEENNRKILVEKVVELTKTRDEITSKLTALSDAHNALLRQRTIDVSNAQSIMIQEAVRRQEEFDEHRTKLQEEESKEMQQHRMSIAELQRELDSLQADQLSNVAVGGLQHQVDEKRAELDLMRQRHKKLKADVHDLEEQVSISRSNTIALNAEQIELTRRHSAENFNAAVLSKKEELRLQTSQLEEMKKYLESLESRKRDLFQNQNTVEEGCRSEIERARQVQDEYSEEMKEAIDENVELIIQQEDHIRRQIEFNFSTRINALCVDYWIGYNNVAITLRLRSSEQTRETLVVQVNAAKDEMTHLAYQSLELDEDISRLSSEIERSDAHKNEIKVRLQSSLDKIKEERTRLMGALSGRSTQSFPLLDTQRELLEGRFELLQKCIALPALPLFVPYKSGSPHSLPTRSSLEEDLVGLCIRLDNCTSESKIENSHFENTTRLLSEKEAHLTSEEEIRQNLLSQLQSADNEVTLSLSRLGGEINQLASDVNVAHELNLRRKFDSALVGNEESRNFRAEEERIIGRYPRRSIKWII